MNADDYKNLSHGIGIRYEHKCGEVFSDDPPCKNGGPQNVLKTVSASERCIFTPLSHGSSQ